MKKYMVWFQIIGMAVLIAFIAIKCENMFKNGSDDSKVDIQSASDVQNYVQGKWHLAYYPSGGLTIHVRLLIEGNTIKTWSAVNDHNNPNDFNWDMNQAPEEEYTFKVGELTEKDSKRYIEWDNNGDLTLQQRAIGDLFVAKTGFHYGASYYVVDKGWEE